MTTAGSRPTACRPVRTRCSPSASTSPRGRRTVTVAAGETAEADFVLGLSAVHEELTVTASVAGAETTLEAFNAATTLDSFDIASEGANTIGEALQNEPGIASRSFGPGRSRSIIRGFDGDRVLVLEDGVRTGDLYISPLFN